MKKSLLKEKAGYYSYKINTHQKCNKEYKLIFFHVFVGLFSFMDWIWLSFRDGFVLFYGRLAESETLHFLQINMQV